MKKQSKPHDRLIELAEARGIMPEFSSTFGGIVRAGPATLLAVLRTLGSDIKDDLSNVDAELERAKSERAQSLSEPCAVAWNGKKLKLPVRLPLTKAKGRVELRIQLENGGPIRVSAPIDRLKSREVGSQSERVFEFAGVLPLGYHQATLKAGGRAQNILIISAPEKAYRDPIFAEKGKLTGVFGPLYALHSKRSWGIGDYRDLGLFVHWALEAGCQFVGTLPLFSGFSDRPFEEPSPYAPVSRLFWNEIFLDPTLAPEWTTCNEARAVVSSMEFQRELKRLRSAELVDYAGVARLKRRVLEPLAEAFFAARGDQSKAYREFLRKKPLVESYAKFRAVCDLTGKTWQQWPERLRSGKIQSGDFRAQDKRYHLYAQWLSHEQLNHVSQQSRRGGVGIYLDFPLSVHSSGFDAWLERESFGDGASAGAPPDTTYVTGQDWGILPLHPEGLRKTGYRYFRACIESQMQYCGMVRLDHVMSLYRLYWVPAGLGAKAGVYVRYNADELFAILTLESHRNQCTLIGEDLGTVPPEVQKQMTRHDVLRMYVQQLSLSDHSERPADPEPANSVVSLNTHDMPMFAAFWRYLDLYDEVDLGHLKQEQLAGLVLERKKLQKRLVAFLNTKKLLDSPINDIGESDADIRNIFSACLWRLARGPAQAMLMNIEDLWLETHRQNVPATWRERPNWRRKMRYSLEDIQANQDWFDIVRRVAQIRAKSPN